MSLFSKIINGEIPSYKIFEDDLTFAFLDINPIQLGHTLIVPKIEIDHFLDLDEPYYSRVFQNAKIVGKAIHKATGFKRIGTIVAGFEVPHFHYHLIPINNMADLDPKQAKKRSQEEMLEIQKKIIDILNQG